MLSLEIDTKTKGVEINLLPLFYFIVNYSTFDATTLWKGQGIEII